MKIKFMVAATLMAALVTTTSCGNSNKQSQSEKTEQAAPAACSSTMPRGGQQLWLCGSGAELPQAAALALGSSREGGWCASLAQRVCLAAAYSPPSLFPPSLHSLLSPICIIST